MSAVDRQAAAREDQVSRVAERIAVIFAFRVVDDHGKAIAMGAGRYGSTVIGGLAQ